jgi:four helix bundle protein
MAEKEEKESTGQQIRGQARRFDLEERTLTFAKKTIELINRLPKTLANTEIGRQLIRSSGSIGANYIEANESLSRKDYVFRVKICRKEAKETRYWLQLLTCDPKSENDREKLIQECNELMKIFGAILEKIK